MPEQSSVVFNIATDKVNVVGIFHRLENYRKRISHFLYGKDEKGTVDDRKKPISDSGVQYG